VLVGLLFVDIGTCGAVTTIVIGCMDVPAGSGVVTAVWVTINIVCVFYSETTTDTGGEFVPTGECGNATSTTVQIDGAGVLPVASADICIVSEFSTAGQVASGWLFAGTGVSTAGTITITTSTDVTDGRGVHTVALVCICTVSAYCTGIIKDIGARCDHTGTCGGAITITRGLDGSGAVTAGSAGTCIGFERTSAGLDPVGTKCGAIGICTAEITTTILIMAERDGLGVAIAASVCTATVGEPCGETTKATGVAFAHTGISGVGITTTVGHVGSGVGIGALAVICTASAS
jgi:hypothetical protein